MHLRWLQLSAFAIFTSSPTPAADDPPPLPREFRGVWVATVANIDWPSKPGLPTEVQKRELLAILNRAKSLNLNAIVFQVRPMADALYPSQLEPWSEFLTGTAGVAPEPAWDPLEFAVAEAHARGLELHAWFNPYRARTPTAKTPSPKNHLVSARPDLAKVYGKHHWLNPTHPEVQKHSLAVILDVVQRYDVDGVHFDDYFYPYPEKDAAGNLIDFPDDDTWAAYQKSGGKLSRADWRRDAVNHFIERLYREVKNAKPWVKVGISPFGIPRPGQPEGIVGFDQYEALYADVTHWLKNGWADYFSPQLYWPIAQEKQSFPKLLAWWTAENTHHRHIWPGLYTSRVTGAESGWRAKEIVDQIAIVRRSPGTDGVVHFSMKPLLKPESELGTAIGRVYAEPALVPSTPWLQAGSGPRAPTVTAEGDAAVKLTAAEGTRFVVIRTHTADGWSTVIRGLPVDGLILRTMSGQEQRVSVIDRVGRESPTITIRR